MMAIHYFHDRQAGAPVLNGQAGSLLSILRACLVTGFGAGTVTAASNVASTVTATAAGHGFIAGDVVELSGAQDSALNGRFTIDSVTVGTFTFKAGSVPSSIAAPFAYKRAGAGWGEEFSGTGIGVFKSVSSESSKRFLRVLDTDAWYARVRGYEGMTSHSVGSAPFPTVSQYGGEGLTWFKSSGADSTPREWALVADGRSFYLFTRPRTDQEFSIYAFGDIAAFGAATPPYSCLLIGQATVSPNYVYDGAFNLSAAGSLGGIWMARGYSAVEGAVQCGLMGSASSGTLGGGGLLFPNPENGALMLHPVAVQERQCWRGVLRGFYQPLHPQPLAHGVVVPGLVVGSSARRVLIVSLQGSGFVGRGALDVTGEWL